MMNIIYVFCYVFVIGRVCSCAECGEFSPPHTIDDNSIRRL